MDDSPDRRWVWNALASLEPWAKGVTGFTGRRQGGWRWPRPRLQSPCRGPEAPAVARPARTAWVSRAGASIPVTYLTVLYSLSDARPRLEAGE